MCRRPQCRSAFAKAKKDQNRSILFRAGPRLIALFDLCLARKNEKKTMKNIFEGVI